MTKKFSILIILLKFSLGFAEQDSIFNLIKEMRFKTATSYLQLKTNTDTIVYSLQLINSTGEEQEIIVELPSEQLDKIDVRLYDTTGLIQEQIFQNKKIEDRVYYDRNIDFPFTIGKSANFRLDFIYHQKDMHNIFKPEVLVWKRSAKINRMQALELTRGVFYGILALYIIISLYLYFLIKTRNYIYYSAYLLSGTLYLFVKNSFAFEYLWPNYPHLDFLMRKVMLSIYLLASVTFLRGFIKSRVKAVRLQRISKQFIIAGIFITFISFLFGLLTPQLQQLFKISQSIFAIACYIMILFTFITAYLKSNNRSLIFFTLVYFLSFSFFLFYPQPEFARDFFGVSLGQIYTYSNAFIIAIIISFTTVYRVLFILRQNEKMKTQMSALYVSNNYALVEGQYRERQRVGQELHDGIGVLLSSVKMKMSALKTTTPEDKIALQKLLQTTDNICTATRTLSHVFLPPTLNKFGIKTALQDMFDAFKTGSKTDLPYTILISDKLSFVSQNTIYDLLQQLLSYFKQNRPDTLQIRLVELKTEQRVQLRIVYSGIKLNPAQPAIQNLLSTIEVLNGKYENTLLNAWTNSFTIEIPVTFE